MIQGIVRIASFAETSDSLSTLLRALHWPNFPIPFAPFSVTRSRQQRRPLKTMGSLRSCLAAALLLSPGALAHGPLGYAQEKPLVGDASFDYAEACPDYAKYSTSPQYVQIHPRTEQISG